MPKVIDHEQRRRDLAEATWRVVARQGLEAATLREIADAARCSTGVLAHYFADKDALIVHTLHLAVERLAARFAARAAARRGADALRVMLHEALPLDDERRREYRIWLEFWGRALAQPALAAEQRRWYDLWHAAARGLIADGQREGTVRRDADPDAEATALIALVDGLSLQAVFDPGRLPPETQISLLDRALARLAAP